VTDVIVGGGPQGTQAKYRSFDGGAFEALVHTLAPYDETTGAALVIDTVHHEVHEGEMFHCAYTNGSVANNGTVDLLLSTGAKEAHSLYEAPTVANGTAVAVYNMKRAASNTPLSTVKHTPTVTNVGAAALVNGRILPGGNSPTTRVGGGIRSGAEWILAPNTQYLMRVVNTSGASIAINVVLEWYEE
jgi:hypothetical protein